MDLWQVCNQLKYLLEARKWEDNAANSKVFSAVFVTFAPDDSVIAEKRVPAAIIVPQNAIPDVDEPGLLIQNIDIRILNMVRGDSVGQDSLLGSNRTATSSAGKGLLEIETELMAILEQLDSNSGITIVETFQNSGIMSEISESGYMVSKTYSIRVYCTNKRQYNAPTRLVATGGAGQVSLSWQLPVDRFDRKKVVLRRASGSTPPETVTDGTNVTLGSDLATSVINTGLSAGTYSYSLFSGYTEYGGATPNKYSDRISRQGVIVT